MTASKNQTPTKERLRRAQICVEALTPKTATIVIPAWRPDERVQLSLQTLPDFVQAGVPLPFRCYAQVNTLVGDAAQLRFEAWEDPRNAAEAQLDQLIVEAHSRSDDDPVSALLLEIFNTAPSGSYQIFPVGTAHEVIGVNGRYTDEQILTLARDFIRAVWRRRGS